MKIRAESWVWAFSGSSWTASGTVEPQLSRILEQIAFLNKFEELTRSFPKYWCVLFNKIITFEMCLCNKQKSFFFLFFMFPFCWCFYFIHLKEKLLSVRHIKRSVMVFAAQLKIFITSDFNCKLQWRAKQFVDPRQNFFEIVKFSF